MTHNESAQLKSAHRRRLFDELLSQGELHGQLELIPFLMRIWDLDSMPSSDPRRKTASGDITQHMIANYDWDDEYLYYEYLHVLDDIFFQCLEQVVHPLVRQSSESQATYVDIINRHVPNEGFHMIPGRRTFGQQSYHIRPIQAGVPGDIKTLIFAARYKPEIIIRDTMSGLIEIGDNRQHCLWYERPIPGRGLTWNDLINWWESDPQGERHPTEDGLYERLRRSLSPNSPPEHLFFDIYYDRLLPRYGADIPALIPQVYMYYDAKLREENNDPYVQCRMDFLMLFSNNDRVIIEIDGKQHYADDDIASPRKYAALVKADRELRLRGYDIYRFGGGELTYQHASRPGPPWRATRATSQLVITFIENLCHKYGWPLTQVGG